MTENYFEDLADFFDERVAAGKGLGSLAPSDAEAAAKALRHYARRRRTFRERLAHILVALAIMLAPKAELRRDSIGLS